MARRPSPSLPSSAQPAHNPAMAAAPFLSSLAIRSRVVYSPTGRSHMSAAQLLLPPQVVTDPAFLSPKGNQSLRARDSLPKFAKPSPFKPRGSSPQHFSPSKQCWRSPNHRPVSFLDLVKEQKTPPSWNLLSMAVSTKLILCRASD